MSRKIDALIHKHIFNDGRAKVVGPVTINGLSPKPIPHYSTDIKAAWEVVEKMGGIEDGRGYCIDISFDGGWIVNVGSNNSTDAESAPMAICLAALKAKGIEQEGKQ